MTVPLSDETRLARAVDLVLTAAGWQRIVHDAVADWPDSATAYEDPYAVVGIWVFSSLSELTARWIDAQSHVTALISTTVVDIQQKAWDGYLLLITPSPAPSRSTSDLNDIRSNTRRLRKIVVTGDELALDGNDDRLHATLRAKLAPLLPVNVEAMAGPIDPLADLPSRLARRGVEPAHIREVLQARDAGTPMVAALHQYLHRDDRPEQTP